ncbi:MAG: bifunctional oligoribonuclease/PAP phosphatase NrnA [Deltaproteobacteria bacterium]|nr:bifunctional oligoribonuclease/PAP phosphatase NrnA [Deltaproteobacteria bacterium]
MIRKIVDIINRHQKFLITAHVKLDGDAVGSELAFYLLLRGLGKDATIYNQDKTPDNYRFLPGSDIIRNTLPPPDSFEVAFILDCSELDRVGDEALRIGAVKTLVNIDHHVSNGGFCEVRLIDPAASSTGELVFRLLTAMKTTITREMATNLYAAIITDTGGFHYGNTGKDTFIAAGHLVESGADPQWISENIYESFPMAKIRLLAKAMQTLSFDCRDRVGSLVIFLKDFEEAGALWEHSEGLVDLPRSIEGVEISILYTELPDRNFKISLRSKGVTNVERVARVFGGGGHVNASGCRIEGNIDTVKKRLLEVICASAWK